MSGKRYRAVAMILTPGASGETLVPISKWYSREKFAARDAWEAASLADECLTKHGASGWMNFHGHVVISIHRTATLRFAVETMEAKGGAVSSAAPSTSTTPHQLVTPEAELRTPQCMSSVPWSANQCL